MEGLNSPEYIKKNGASIAVPKIEEEYLFKYKKNIKNLKQMFDKDLTDCLIMFMVWIKAVI